MRVLSLLIMCVQGLVRFLVLQSCHSLRGAADYRKEFSIERFYPLPQQKRVLVAQAGHIATHYKSMKTSVKHLDLRAKVLKTGTMRIDTALPGPEETRAAR